MTLSQTEREASPTSREIKAATLPYSDDSARSAQVAWPDEDADEYEPPSSSPSAVTSPNSNPKKSQATQSAAPWSTSSLKKTASRDVISPTSSSAPSIQQSKSSDSWRQKKYAPWEKPAEEHPEDQAFRAAPNKWKKPDPVATGASPTAGRSTPTPTSTSSSRTGRFAPWEKPQLDYPDPEPEEDSEIGERARSTISVASSAALGYSARSKVPPWQKAQQEIEYPVAEPDMDSEIGARVSSEVPVSRSTASRQSRSAGKPAPWQKQQQQEPNDEVGIQRSGSWQNSNAAPALKHRSSTPTYEIGRAWQKPRSPKRQPSRAPPPPPPLSSAPSNGSGQKTPVQMWRRKEQEAKTTNVPQTPETGKKVAPWQRDMSARKGPQERAPPSPSPNYNEVPQQGKAPTPSWKKPKASASPFPRQPQQSKEPSWKKTVAASRAALLEAPSTPLRDDSSPQNHDQYLRTPIPFDAAAAQESEYTPTIGGAVIETPKSQSVASLRASLGSKPAPPPLPGSTPARADRSPGDSPWLAGNRKSANRVGSPYLGGNNGALPPSTPILSAEKPAPAPPRSVNRTPPMMVKSQTPTQTTPVTSHDSDEAREARRRMATPSPIKSLAEMAADSVMITDYSQLALEQLKSEEYLDDDESLLSNGIATNTPSHAELPAEFRSILDTSSYQDIIQQRSQESNMSTLGGDDRSPTSQALTPEDLDRRTHLHDRVENYSADEDDEEEISPSRSIPPIAPSRKDQTRRKSRTPARPHPSQVSAETLNRSRPMGQEVEGNDAGASSSAIFGEPATFGAAGGEAEIIAPAVSDRTRAIESWNRGYRGGSPSHSGAGELDTVARSSPRGRIDTRSPRSGGPSPTISASSASPAGMRERRESIERRSHIHTTPSDEGGGSYASPTRSAREASRILKFFQSQDDELTGEEESEWANRDPGDIDVMRDESPSPEPYTQEPEPEPDIEIADYPVAPARPPRSPSNTKSVHFVEGEEQYYDEAPPVQQQQLPPQSPEKLSMADVFDPFWSTSRDADETFEFDEADASFFSSTSMDEKAGANSPFRVVLKPPRASPATRARRQHEASHSYDSHYARYSNTGSDGFYDDANGGGVEL
jgi:hypothetical protein